MYIELCLALSMDQSIERKCNDLALQVRFLKETPKTFLDEIFELWYYAHDGSHCRVIDIWRHALSPYLDVVVKQDVCSSARILIFQV
jgi:hypothetical protein